MIMLVRPQMVDLKILGRKKGLNTTQFSIYPGGFRDGNNGKIVRV